VAFGRHVLELGARIEAAVARGAEGVGANVGEDNVDVAQAQADVAVLVGGAVGVDADDGVPLLDGEDAADVHPLTGNELDKGVAKVPAGPGVLEDRGVELVGPVPLAAPSAVVPDARHGGWGA
jgi:hypothetical protein